MKNFKISPIIIFIISFLYIDLMAGDRHHTDTIHNIDKYGFDKQIISSKWSKPIANKASVIKMKEYANPDSKNIKMRLVTNLANTSAIKLRVLAQGNIDRYVRNAYKATFNLNNERDTYEENHKKQIRMLGDPMNLQRHFNYKIGGLTPLVIWKSN